MTAPGPGDWVKVVISQADWDAALTDAGITGVRVLTHEGMPGFRGEGKHLAQLMLALIHYVGLNDALLVATLTRDYHHHDAYFFPGLQLL